MKSKNKLKIINDPIYGFITVPTPLIFELIEHRYFQRLRRITQMGMSYLVYPGAQHTRFHHALGAMFLMQRAIQVLRFKQVAISEEESEALLIAILLHDIGHGPFSHAMEHSLVEAVSHEHLSLLFMEQLNEQFDGRLQLAIDVFTDNYHRGFMHQLVSGQLDMDRLDYLRRDSFFTGVTEGNVNSQRLIAMLNVKDDALVVEEKGIYSVEKFIVARRLMYWQVYLHKTGLVAEQLLVRVLQRAKELYRSGVTVNCSEALELFLSKNVPSESFDLNLLETFAQLDDIDILSAMKSWRNHPDWVLAQLSNRILDRTLLRIKVKDKPFDPVRLEKKRQKLMKRHNLSQSEASYLVFGGTISNQAYSMEKENINLIRKNGKVIDVAKASDQLNIEALSQLVVKHYICYPKND